MGVTKRSCREGGRFDAAVVRRAPRHFEPLACFLIETVANCHRELLAFGPPGTGKTQLVAGIGYAPIDRGLKELFARTSELVRRLQAALRDLRAGILLCLLSVPTCPLNSIDQET